MISPEKWLDAFDKADFRDEMRPLILKEKCHAPAGRDGVI